MSNSVDVRDGRVSELVALRIEITVLKLQALQARATALVAEQQQLIEEARLEVGAPQDSVYNTDSRMFQARPDHAG